MAEPNQIEAEPGSGTGAGMLAFLDYLIKKNEIVENSGIALRLGTRRVLETDDSLFAEDVRSMNIEDVIRRFKIKNRGGQFKDSSLNDYEKRFKQTVEMYLKWLDNDPTWRPAPRKAAVTPRQTKSEPAAGRGTKATKAAAGLTGLAPVIEAAIVQDTSPVIQMVEYPYPVRPGLMAQVVLPADLTAKEAERVAKFVASLAFDERLAITARPTDS